LFPDAGEGFHEALVYHALPPPAGGGGVEVGHPVLNFVGAPKDEDVAGLVVVTYEAGLGGIYDDELHFPEVGFVEIWIGVRGLGLLSPLVFPVGIVNPAAEFGKEQGIGGRIAAVELRGRHGEILQGEVVRSIPWDECEPTLIPIHCLGEKGKSGKGEKVRDIGG